MDLNHDHSQVESVSQLFNEDGWDHTILHDKFDEETYNHINSVKGNLVFTQLGYFRKNKKGMFAQV